MRTNKIAWIFAVCLAGIWGVNGVQATLQDYVGYWDFDTSFNDQSINAYNLAFAAIGGVAIWDYSAVAGPTTPSSGGTVGMRCYDNGTSIAAKSVNTMAKVKAATSAITVTCWQKAMDSNSATRTALSIGCGSGNRMLLLQTQNSICLPSMVTYNGGTANVTMPSGSQEANNGTWYFVAATFSFDNTTNTAVTQIYQTNIARDNISQGIFGTNTYSGSTKLTTPSDTGGYPWGSPTPVYYGFVVGSDNSSNFWNGTIDELAIWNRVLNSDEINGLFVAGKNRIRVNNAVPVSYTKSKVSGTVVLGDSSGDLRKVAVKVDLQQGGVSKYVKNIILTGTGKFVVPDVLYGTYDVVVKAYAHKSTTVAGVVVSGPPVTIAGPITLVSSDLDGDNSVTVNDLSILLTNVDKTGDQ